MLCDFSQLVLYFIWSNLFNLKVKETTYNHLLYQQLLGMIGACYLMCSQRSGYLRMEGGLRVWSDGFSQLILLLDLENVKLLCSVLVMWIMMWRVVLVMSVVYLNSGERLLNFWPSSLGASVFVHWCDK